MNALALTISDISIRQDDNGRYCLNDLHKAAGNETKHKPSEWLRNKQAVELIAEIEKAGIPAIQSKQQLGTFAVKDLVYAYAMWISAAFTLKVIHAYDALVTKPVSLPEPKTKKALPGGLTLAHQDDIKALVKKNVEHLPHDKRAGHTIKQWSAIKAKFGCSYKEIPDADYLNVIALLSRLPIEGELLKKPAQEPPFKDGSIEARKHIDHLRQAMLTGMDEIILNEAMEELNKIERCIISAWTHMDESLMRLHTCVSMLSRWRGAH